MNNAAIPEEFYFNPLSPSYLENPAPAIKRLQEDSPVFFYEPLGCWVVSRFADLREAFRDTATFSSQATGLRRPPLDLEEAVADLTVEKIVIMLDPPEHTLHRNAIAKGFGSAFINSLGDRIKGAANELIDRFIERGHTDLMTQFCMPLTMETIIHLLQIPGDRRTDYFQWSADFFSLLSPRAPGNSEERRDIDDVSLRERWSRLAEANSFIRSYIADLKNNLGSDIISGMLKPGENGSSAIHESAVVGHLLSIIGAGHDTTANAIAHTVHYLSTAIEQRDEMVANPDLIANAIEEAIRMRGSVPGIFRYTTCDVELGGVTIPANSLVYLLAAASGHDESVFPDSMRFDIHRENASKHLAFGFGRHNCVGSGLARLQAGIAIRELYRRMPDLREAPGFRRTYRPFLTVTGLTSLEVTWKPPCKS